ncbi:MAG: cache domain-containing protein, partial [Phycisphaerales bacterium]|nr:cache domain-containing protein [Phycisphaerales bacterium]
MSAGTSDTTLRRAIQQLRSSTLVASLRFRLILLVALAVLPALGVVIYTAAEQRREGLDHARDEALRLVRTAASTHDQSIDSSRQLLATIAQMQVIRERDVARARDMFVSLLGQHRIYANFGAMNPDGSVLASAVPLGSHLASGQPEFFRKAVAQRDFVTGEYHVTKATREATLHNGLPVYDAEGQLLTVLFAALDLGWLYEMHAQALLPPGSSFTVTDHNRITILRFPDPEGKFIGEPLRTTTRRTGPRPPERTTIFRGRDGVLRLYAFAPLSRIETE